MKPMQRATNAMRRRQALDVLRRLPIRETLPPVQGARYARMGSFEMRQCLREFGGELMPGSPWFEVTS